MNYFTFLLFALLAFQSASFGMHVKLSTQPINALLTDQHFKLNTRIYDLSNEKIRFAAIGGDYKGEIAKRKDIEALKKCETIRDMLSDLGGTLDLDNEKAWLTSENIKLLAEYIKNPQIIAKKTIERNKEILRVADFFEAPENIHFELSNVLWRDLQDQKGDLKEVVEEKKTLREIADRYLYSPAYLAKFIELDKEYFTKLVKSLYTTHHDLLSHDKLLTLVKDQPWIADKHGNQFNLCHKFATLKGFNTLIKTFAQMIEQPNDLKASLDISGHNLREFSLKTINQKYLMINASNNIINTFDITEVKYVPKVLVLSKNEISSLDDGFFESIKEWRSEKNTSPYSSSGSYIGPTYGTECSINLENNPINKNQTQEIINKLYQANYTLPERSRRLNWYLKTGAYGALYMITPLACIYSYSRMFGDLIGQNDAELPFYLLRLLPAICTIKFIHDIGADVLENNLPKESAEMKGFLASIIPGFYSGFGITDTLDKKFSIPPEAEFSSFIGALLGIGSIIGIVGLGSMSPLLLSKAKEFIQNKIGSRMVKISHPKITIDGMGELKQHYRVQLQLNEEEDAATGKRLHRFLTDGNNRGKNNFPNSEYRAKELALKKLFLNESGILL